MSTSSLARRDVDSGGAAETAVQTLREHQALVRARTCAPSRGQSQAPRCVACGAEPGERDSRLSAPQGCVTPARTAPGGTRRTPTGRA